MLAYKIMCYSRYLFQRGLAAFMCSWLLSTLLLGGCQSTGTDEREQEQYTDSPYDLTKLDVEERKKLLHIGLSEEEVLKKWGEPELREPSPEDKNKIIWFYTRIVPITSYVLKEKIDEKTGETIYVEEPVKSLVEHISRKFIFVNGKLDSWYIYPAGLTPDMSRARPYTADGESP
jgi:hypothetical protein